MAPAANAAAVRLACQLVNQQYGPVCERVCAVLLRRSTQTQAGLGRLCNLPRRQLQTALKILIQQNCVMCYQERTSTSASTGKAAPNHVFAVDVDRVLENIRKPRYMKLVGDEVGELAEFIIEVLLEHGRLRIEQVVHSVHGKLKEGAQIADEDILKTFSRLVTERFVERAPPGNLAPPVAKVQIKASKRDAESARALDEDVDVTSQGREQLYQQMRFFCPPHLLMANPTEQSGASTSAPSSPQQRNHQNRKRGGAEVPRGASKRPRASAAAEVKAEPVDETGVGIVHTGAAALSAVGGGGPSDQNILWRTNHQEMNRRLRWQACVMLTEERLGTDKALVVDALLRASRHQAPKHHTLEEESVPQTASDVAVAISGVPHGAANKLNLEIVRTSLEDLIKDDLSFVKQENNAPGGWQYCVHLSAGIDKLRMRATECVVKNRFGPLGLRVMRVLVMHKQLEQKGVADLALIPQKDTRELLYRLLKAGYVSLQDVPKTADHAPSRTLYTWHVDMEAVRARLHSELLRAAGNVCARLKHEMDEYMKSAPTRTDGQQRMRTITSHLEACLMETDDMIALMK